MGSSSLKQQIHDLVDELPDDSPLLVEVRETLRMNHAIGEAMEDVRERPHIRLGGIHGESAGAMAAQRLRVKEADGIVEVLRFWHSHRDEPFRD